MEKLSIVIPVYKSSEILESLTSLIFHEVKVNLTNYKIQLIFVVDSSPDNSWNVIKKIKKNYHKKLLRFEIIALNLSLNFGQHNAIIAGVSEADGKYILTMDDDLQHSPKDIVILLNEIKKGYDLVYGVFKNKYHSNWKKIGSKFNNFLATYLINKPKNISISPFRIFNKNIKSLLINNPSPFPYIDGIIFNNINSISQVYVSHSKRLSGTGNFSFFKSFSLLIKMAMNFSIVPLRLSLFFGLIASLIGFILSIYYFILFLSTESFPPGWLTLVLIILIIGGVQLLMIGVVGEYIGRLFLTMNKKPKFYINEKI